MEKDLMQTLAEKEAGLPLTVPHWTFKNRSSLPRSDQGLTLVHFSARRKHILWDTLGV